MRSRPCLQTGFQRKFVVFLVLLSLGRDKDTLAEDEVPGGGGACSAAEGFHQGCLSRSAARRAAERKRGKQQTLSLASACRGKGRTERVCLSGESREKQAAWRSGEERGGTAAAAGTSLGACGAPLVNTSRVKKTPPRLLSPPRGAEKSGDRLKNEGTYSDAGTPPSPRSLRWGTKVAVGEMLEPSLTF